MKDIYLFVTIFYVIQEFHIWRDKENTKETIWKWNRIRRNICLERLSIWRSRNAEFSNLYTVIGNRTNETNGSKLKFIGNESPRNVWDFHFQLTLTLIHEYYQVLYTFIDSKLGTIELNEITLIGVVPSAKCSTSFAAFTISIIVF